MLKHCLRLPGLYPLQSKIGHVHKHFSSPDEPIRNREVADLIERWKPFCNGSPIIPLALIDQAQVDCVVVRLIF